MNLREFRSILRQSLFFPVALLLLLAGFFLVQMGRLSSALRAVDRSDQITNRIVELQKLILDQETGMRGYELNNDPVMLAPYNASVVPIRETFAELREMFAGDDAQEQRLAVLSSRYGAWFDRSKRMIARDPALIDSPQIHQENKLMMDRIRSAVTQMLVQEEWRRGELSQRAPDLERRELISIVVAALLIGLAVAFFIWERLRLVSNSYDAALRDAEQRSHEAHESRQWFQTTLESIGDAVIACDATGRVEFANAVAAELTGWTAEELLGKPLEEAFKIVNEETRKTVESPVEKVRRHKNVIGLANHTMLISRDGKERLIDDSAAPIFDESGEMRGIVLVFHDVTEQRRTQAALISGEKLAVAGRLAASIAHEIHNPLDSVTNLLFLLRDETDKAKRAEYLKTAEQELGRTMEISRAMLRLYREPKEPIQVNLKELLESVLLLLERRIAEQEILTKTEFAANCIVEGFPAELRQVITNVVVNAIEAAGSRGHVRIRLKGAPAEELRGAGALIEVADSGPGIPEGNESKLFQPFFTTKGENGTGLGLWVSMGIVQKHGGMMRLLNCHEKEYGGACVRIYLPTRRASRANPY